MMMSTWRGRVEARIEELNTFRNWWVDVWTDLSGKFLMRQEYETRHHDLQEETDTKLRILREVHDRDVQHIESLLQAFEERVQTRLTSLERWRANVMGRAVALGIGLVLLTATVTALIAHVVK